MPYAQPLELALLLQTLEGVLADGLQHRVALAVAPDQALVDERSDRVDVRLADRLGGLERAAADEHREPGEDTLLLDAQQLVAPRNRRPERPLALRRIPWASNEDRQTPVQAAQQVADGKRLHARRGELYREGKAVEASADLDDGVFVREVRLDRGRPLHEERLGLALAQRGDRILVLAGKVQRLPAGDQRLQPGKSREQVAEPRRGVEHLLEVVEDQQQPPVRHLLDDRVAGPDRARDRRQHELGIAQALQRDPEHAVRRVGGEVRRQLNGEPRLPGSARAGQRYESMRAEEPARLVELLPAPDQRG